MEARKRFPVVFRLCALQLGQAGAAEAVLRSRLAAPLVRAAIQQQQQQAAGDLPLPALLPQLLAAVSSSLAHVLDLTLTDEAVAAGFNVLVSKSPSGCPGAGCPCSYPCCCCLPWPCRETWCCSRSRRVWPSTSQPLSRQPTLLSSLPTTPPAKSCWRSWRGEEAGRHAPSAPRRRALPQRVAHSIRRRCPTLEALERFRSSEPFQTFQKRWNLPVFYSLRLQEVAGAVEAALQQPALVPAAAAADAARAPDFVCQATAVVWDSVRKCFEHGNVSPGSGRCLGRSSLDACPRVLVRLLLSSRADVPPLHSQRRWRPR